MLEILFIGQSNVLAGVTSFGLNGNCAGTGGVYRVDRADDLDWLYGTFGEHLPWPPRLIEAPVAVATER